MDFSLFILWSLIVSKVYDKARQEVLGKIDNEDLKERLVGGGLPSKDSLRTAATTARCIPKAPTTHDDIRFDTIPYKNKTADSFLLRRSSRPGEIRDIMPMGTPRTVRKFVSSKFKSGDATFSCAPKLFYQVILSYIDISMATTFLLFFTLSNHCFINLILWVIQLCHFPANICLSPHLINYSLTHSLLQKI